MKQLHALLLLSLCSLTIAYGRPPDIPIQGKVVSYLEKQPLAGVTVVIKGSHKGIITDTNGAFSLEAQAFDTLILFFLGGIRIFPNLTSLFLIYLLI